MDISVAAHTHLFVSLYLQTSLLQVGLKFLPDQAHLMVSRLH